MIKNNKKNQSVISKNLLNSSNSSNYSNLPNSPLADQIRPKNLSEIIGQKHLFGQNSAFEIIKNNKNIPSLILWGPPGVGKTTIAKALANEVDARFVIMSAINSGASDIRKIIEEAKEATNNKRNDDFGLFSENKNQETLEKGKKTILMIDEIHHFNKTQQDLFLPFIEDGTIILIGTTTQNPSFALNSAILSRCKVLSLENLQEDDLEEIIKRAEKFQNKKLPLTKNARKYLLNLACGDARYLLNACEELLNLSQQKKDLEVADLKNIISKRSALFDNRGDVHFNLISAFHKSLRGSDVDAALYYLARMLEAKEDPLYILRRMARFATEDVGLADPNALLQVMAAKENFIFLGSPEGDYALSHAAIYLATAPKSNASYMAHKAAILDAKNSPQINPPKNILNAPTNMMKDLGYHQGYIYDHDTEECFSGQEFFPNEILDKYKDLIKSKTGDKKRPKYYRPNERGFERDLKKRLKYWNELKEKINKKDEKF